MSGVRERSLVSARSFIGTPYRHQGARRGVGCDCLGLVRGVWRDLYGTDPEDPGAYSAGWAEHTAEERLLDAAARHLLPLDGQGAEPGDVLVFRWRDGVPAKHCGILDEGRRLIHAYEGMAVTSSPLVPAWARRAVGAFRFPEP